ncbi:hypothetical protein R3W88_014588 [Solanum pinnatisectum]|uniref:Uncharacterized protein n=1 Tax=Solanum pinnatisectum TaxID=50273 RepID=A0AAV9KUH5_9SOLN|nr:hypothetical protein R3W88_014588 [Solanum pinnatisectum]
MMNLRDDIQGFKRWEGEHIHETLVRFKKLLLKFPNHGLPNELLLQYFYQSLDAVNKGVVDQLVRGGIMLQSFEVASFLLDDMTKINQAWYTQEDQASPFCFILTQEQHDKERERDENIKKMLTQMEFLQEHMKGTCGVFRVKEVLSLATQGWGRIKVGTPRSMRTVFTYAIYSGVGIKVGAITGEKRKEDIIKIGEMVVVTRRGKVAIGDVKRHEEPQMHEEETPIHQSISKGPQKDIEKHNKNPKAVQPLPKIAPPFSQRLKKKNEDEKFKKFLSLFKTLSINLPLVEPLLEMLGYAKFIKELVTKKRSLDFETIEVSHSCSSIMTKELIKKKEDPRAFTVPCTIDMLQFPKALCYLGASINLMPYAIYK